MGQVKNSGRLYYLEPNNISGKVPNGIPFPYEDYCVAVDLTVETFSRNVCGVPGDDNSTKITFSSHNGTISFVGGTNGYLTTSYTDISPANLGGGNKECLVIESINISYNSWFYPEVVIKFVDVRGASLMMPESNGLNEAIRRGQETTTSGSFFNALFSFPYPKFTLSVKGFYGKEVNYELAVSKFDSKFNATNGSFDVTVNFIGYMYGIYADLPLNIVGCAPYMDYGGKHYWETADFRYDGSETKIKTLPELHTAIGMADANAKKINGSGKAQVEANTFNQMLKDASKAKRVFEEFRSAVLFFDNTDKFIIQNLNKADFLQNSVAKIFRLRSEDEEKQIINRKENGGDLVVIKGKSLLSLINKLNTDGAKYGLSVKYPYSLNESNMVTDTFLWQVAPKSTVRITADKDGNYYVGENDERKKLENNIYVCDGVALKIQATGYLYCYELNENGFVRSVESVIETLTSKLEESKKDLEKVRETTFDTLLQFPPTIGNIYKTIFAQIDAFMSVFHQCLRNIRSSSNRKLSDYTPDENNLTWDVQSRGGKSNATDTMLPPFPMFSKRNDNKWENVWVGSLGPKYRELEEVKLTESIVRAARQYGEAEKDADEKIKKAAESTGGIDNNAVSLETGEIQKKDNTFIPLTKYDITHASTQANPYFNFSYSFNNDATDMLDNLMALLFERYAYYLSSQDDYYETFARCESFNFYQANPILKIPKSFGDRLKEMSSSKSVLSYIQSWEKRQNDVGPVDVLKYTMDYGVVCKSNQRLSQLLDGVTANKTDENNYIERGSSKFILLGRGVFKKLSAEIKSVSPDSDKAYVGQSGPFGIIDATRAHMIVSGNKKFSTPILVNMKAGPSYGYIIDNKGYGNNIGIDAAGAMIFNERWVAMTTNIWGEALSAGEAMVDDSADYIINNNSWAVAYVGLIGSPNTGYSSMFASPLYYMQEEVLNRAYLFAQTLPDMPLSLVGGKYVGKPELLTALIKEGAYYWREKRVKDGTDTMRFSLLGANGKNLFSWKTDVDAKNRTLKALISKGETIVNPKVAGDKNEYVAFTYSAESEDRKRVLMALFEAWANGFDDEGYLENIPEYMWFPNIERNFSLYKTYGDETAEMLYKNMEAWDENILPVKDLINAVIPADSVARASYVSVYKIAKCQNGLFLTVDSSSSVSEEMATFFTAVVNTIDENSLPRFEDVKKSYSEGAKGDFLKGIAAFFSALYDKYKEDLGNDLGYMSNFEATNVSTDDVLNDDVCLSTYMVLKNLYDRWISTKPESVWKLDNEEGEFSKFKFVDAYFNNISNRLKVNMNHVDTEISKVVSTLNSNTTVGATNYNNVSILSFLSNVASKNGMVLMCLPLDMFTREAMLDFSTIFTPQSYLNSVSNKSKDTSSYVCIYSSRPSSKLALGDDSGNNMYKDDGFTVADAMGNIVEESKDLYGLDENGGGNPVSVFGVTYAKQNQSYFKNISVGMENPQVTEASIAATMNIAAAANAEPRAPMSFGQDLYRVYSDYSYTCKVDMLGCAQILPLMYFQLNNIPLFRGVYMITKVEHSIAPGDMTTSFTGVRIARDRVPFLDAEMIYPTDGKDFTDGNYLGEETSSARGDTQYPGVANDGSDTVVEGGKTLWKELLKTSTPYNNTIRKTGTLTADEIKNNLISLTQNIIEKVRGNNNFSRINCAYRSPSVNYAVGGSSGSDHMKGCAVDIGIKDRKYDNVVAFAKWCNEERKKGNLLWGQMIVYNSFCHLSYGGSYGTLCTIKRKVGDSYVDYQFTEDGKFVRK